MLICVFLFWAVVYLPGAFHPRQLAGFVDDTFIFFRYAQNLANGNGFTWNVGEHPVEGVSSIVWTAVIAGFHRVSNVRMPVASLYAGLICGALSIGVLWVAIRRTPGRGTYAWLGALVLAVSPLVARHAISGMETPLVMLAYSVLLACMAGPRQSADPTRPRLVGLVAGGFFLVRPDATLFALVAPLAAFASWGREGEFDASIVNVRRNLKPTLAFLGAFLAMLLVTFVGRWLYFGVPFPLPAYMKLGLSRPGDFVGLWRFILTNWTLFFSYTALLTFPIGLRLVACPRPSSLEVGVATGVLAFVAYQLQVVPVMNFEVRFMAPLLVPLAFLAAGSVPALVQYLTVSPQRRAASMGVFCGVLVLSSLGYMHGVKVKSGTPYYASMERIGEALALAPPITIAYSEAGALPYYSGHRFLDYAGLNDPFIARNRFVRGFPARYWDYVRREFGMPDVYFQPMPEYASYAALEVDADAVVQYDGRRDICGAGIFVLTRSPAHDAIVSALDGVRCN